LGSVILKSVIICLWPALQFNINILNVALNIGELEFRFLNSYIPEVTLQAFYPSFPFCMLAIAPNSLSGFCAFAIGSRLLLLLNTLVEATTINVDAIATSIIAFVNWHWVVDEYEIISDVNTTTAI
jgi:hypothetical protein